MEALIVVKGLSLETFPLSHLCIPKASRFKQAESRLLVNRAVKRKRLQRKGFFFLVSYYRQLYGHSVRLWSSSKNMINDLITIRFNKLLYILNKHHRLKRGFPGFENMSTDKRKLCRKQY